MRNMLRGAAGVAAGLLVLTGLPAEAAPRESSLLGIKLWRTYRDVLAKHGQPTRIEVGAVTAPLPGQGQGAAAGFGGGAAGDLGAGPMMGGPMMGGSGGMAGGPMAGSPSAAGGMAGYGAAMNQSMGMSRRGGMMGPPGGGMMGGPPPGVMGGGRMMGMGGAGMAPGQLGNPEDDRPGIGGGLPGLPGAGGGPLGGFGMGPGGMGGMMGGGMGQATASDGEVTWVYEKGQLTYLFLFNKDGRVIQISQFGYKGGGTTSRGLSLGAPVRAVYSKYGWADSSAKAGNQLTLDYSHKANVAFQLLNRGKGAQVVGVTVAITERDRIPGQG